MEWTGFSRAVEFCFAIIAGRSLNGKSRAALPGPGPRQQHPPLDGQRITTCPHCHFVSGVEVRRCDSTLLLHLNRCAVTFHEGGEDYAEGKFRGFHCEPSQGVQPQTGRSRQSSPRRAGFAGGEENRGAHYGRGGNTAYVRRGNTAAATFTSKEEGSGWCRQ